MKKIYFLNKLQHFVVPFIVTILSAVIQKDCIGDFVCLFGGRGFPVAYFDGSFSLMFFVTDFIFWIIIYLVLSIAFLGTKKLFKKSK